MMHRLILAAAAALSLGACATQTASNTPMPTDRDCFLADNVSGYSVIDDHHVRIRAGVNREYVLTTSFDSRDLDWGQHIALRSTTSWICTGSAPGVQVYGGSPPRLYPIASVARLPETTPQGS